MILQAKNLEVGYGNKTLLSGLNFEVVEGELICLMGANGCGKTTLLRSLSGLIPILGGDIQLTGRSLVELDEIELARQLSVVLTDKPILENLKVEEVIALGRYPHLGFWGRLSLDDTKIIDETFELLNIGNLKGFYFNELSDGQKQKVFIARALAQDTPMILLDEPTTFLDISHRMEVLKLLQNITEVKGKTLLFTSHDWELVLEMGGQVWLIDNEGRLHRGLVEDIILTGVFEKTFSAKDFQFDYARGSFKEKRILQEKIYIEGESKERVEWTKRALEKLGLEAISSSAPAQLQVKENSWHYKNQEFSDLSSLIKFIKSQ